MHHAVRPFRNRGSGLLVRNAVRNLHQLVGVDHTQLAVGAGWRHSARADIDDPIAHFDVADTRTQAFDNAGAFVAQDRGQRQLGVDIERAIAQIDVGIVQANGGVPQQHFARTGLRHVHILPSENFRPAILVDAYCLRHDADSGLRRISRRSPNQLCAIATLQAKPARLSK